MTEDGSAAAAIGRVLHEFTQSSAIEDIVAKDQRAALAVDKVLADKKCLGDAVGVALARRSRC